MSKHYTARDLQAAFVEGAKFEYERLIKLQEERRGPVQIYHHTTGKVIARRVPFHEKYNERKDARYAAAAEAYPVPQVKRKMVDGLWTDGIHFYESDGSESKRSLHGWTPADFRAMANLLEHPTEDAA